MSNKRTGHLTVVGRRVIALVSIGAMIVLLGCSLEGRRRVMRFFFEYPEPSAAAPERSEETPARVPEPAPDESGGSGGATFVARRDEFGTRVGSIHPPFAERRCRNCHVSEMSQAPLADFRTACQGCHAPYFEYHRFGHGPAVSGDCRFCHVMHVSGEKALLTAPQAELCTTCHPAQQDDGASNSYHRGIEGVACTDCHEAHFAFSQSLLKPQEVRKRAMETGERTSVGGSGP